MYSLYTVTDTIRVPPSEFGGELKDNILRLAQEEYEGILDEDVGVVIAVTDIQNIGDGKVVPGDGAAYYDAELKILTYKPEMHETVEAYVTDITEFGAFLRTGPIEGLVHVSQVMDDFINFDAKLPGFVGKETKSKLMKGDDVLAKVVTISMKGSISNSKIGLTMRQEGLGKEGWAQKKDKKTKTNEEKKEGDKK